MYQFYVIDLCRPGLLEKSLLGPNMYGELTEPAKPLHIVTVTYNEWFLKTTTKWPKFFINLMQNHWFARHTIFFLFKHFINLKFMAYDFSMCLNLNILFELLIRLSSIFLRTIYIRVQWVLYSMPGMVFQNIAQILVEACAKFGVPSIFYKILRKKMTNIKID